MVLKGALASRLPGQAEIPEEFTDKISELAENFKKLLQAKTEKPAAPAAAADGPAAAAAAEPEEDDDDEGKDDIQMGGGADSEARNRRRARDALDQVAQGLDGLGAAADAKKLRALSPAPAAAQAAAGSQPPCG